MEGIHFYKRPKLKNPYLIVAWPGMGEVAFKAARFLVEKLSAEELASIDSADFFYLTGSVIKEGIIDIPELPYNNFYYWRNPATKIGGSAKNLGGKTEAHDLIIFISNAQPDLSRSSDYCERILSVVRTFGIKMVICFAAMPMPIDHTQEPAVWFAATDKKINENLVRYNIKAMSEGQISGMNGLFLGVAKSMNLNGFCLLSEIPLYTIQIENPKASYALLDALNRILDISFDLKGLKDQANSVEGQINQLIDYLKLGGEQPPPIGEDEIEKIKKSLSEYSKLPQSIRIKIEKFFAEARKDLSKANELKIELDKWNVYREYEDRFLDLFKKPKDKGN
jgi:hypothetical protein